MLVYFLEFADLIQALINNPKEYFDFTYCYYDFASYVKKIEVIKCSRVPPNIYIYIIMLTVEPRMIDIF